MPDRSGGQRHRCLRIAMLTHSINPRGGVVHALELADALHDRGHDVTLFAPAFEGQTLFREARCQVSLVPLATPASDVVEMVRTRRAALVSHLSHRPDSQRFEVFHAQDSISGNALADLCDIGAITGFVRTVHHLDHFDDARLMAWQRRAYERASDVFCVSRIWCDRMLAEHGIATTQVSNGVDLQRFHRTPQLRDAGIAAKHGLRASGPTFLAVGGIERRKNTLRMLEAFIEIHSRQPLAQLVIAGGASLLDHDEYGRRFSTMLKASGLLCGPNESVVVTGTVPDADMPALYRRADALLMPSTREGFGMAVLEALASGTPAVVSRLAPFTEYLPEDEAKGHCCWADPTSVASLADAMRRACAPEHAAALGRSLPDVCHRFAWPSSAERHELLYRAHQSLASARRPQGRAA